MKTKHFIAMVIGLIGLSACTQEEYFENLSKVQEESTLTRSLVSESDSIITPLEIDSAWIEAVKSHLAKIKPSISSVSPFEAREIDNDFSSNIWNIREMPITIKARGIKSGNGYYLSSNGLGKEITLSPNGDQTQQKFYLKILPSISGIPYQIYSQETNTPLSVGQYSNNPDNKILFAPKDNSGSLMSSGWDLIPSQYNKGYFAIESQGYWGQSDPNNMWSVFNYVLEAKENNTLGYGEYTQKSQQEFLITPDKSFTINKVTLIDGTEDIREGEKICIKSEGINRSIEPQPFSINVEETSHYETSCFAEKQGYLNFNKSAAGKFQRPTVIAGRISYANLYDAQYSPSTQKLPKSLKYTVEGIAPENCKIEVSTYITTYNVSMGYKAEAACNFNGEQRKILISGTWRGRVIADPKNKKPEHIPSFYDLDTGEKITYYKASKIKTIIK